MVESITEPVRRLQEDGAWFTRARDVRLLYVHTRASLRATALRTIAQLEYHADNASPFVTLETPWAGPDHGADARAATFVERFAATADALRAAGVEVPAFARTLAAAPGHAALADALRRACVALQPPLRGLVIVLAPTRIDDGEAHLLFMRRVLATETLRDVRWAVVEADTRHLASLAAELGERSALSLEFVVDEAAQQRDLAALVGPAGAGNDDDVLPPPWGPWSSGGAMPRAVPPRRVDDRPAATDEQLRAAGLEPTFVKGGAQRLRRLMLGAALALRQGDTERALTLQARTAELCGAMHMHREQAIHLLVLGGYQLGAAQPDRARRTYERAVALAASQGLPLQQAQGELAIGMLDAVEQRPSAAERYAAAAELSEAAGSRELAIECWRMAGEAIVERKLPRAIEHWTHALELATALGEARARATSAADIARLLANARATRGERAEAHRLHRAAFHIERGAEPEGAAPSPSK